jgi:hypothetical protein
VGRKTPGRDRQQAWQLVSIRPCRTHTVALSCRDDATNVMACDVARCRWWLDGRAALAGSWECRWRWVTGANRAAVRTAAGRSRTAKEGEPGLPSAVGRPPRGHAFLCRREESAGQQRGQGIQRCEPATALHPGHEAFGALDNHKSRDSHHRGSHSQHGIACGSMS